VALYRAMESERPDALFRDPYARRLAGERGERIVASMRRGRAMAWPMIVRTAVLDELILRAIERDGVDTVLNLAAGLDTRPYRLPLPSSLRWVEADFPDVRRPACEIWIEPTLEDIHDFTDRFIKGCRLLSVDIETTGSRVTCIGFATSADRAIVIPFDDERSKGGSYWPDKSAESSAWHCIRRVLIDGSIPKLFQNGLYDIAFLWRAYGIGVRGAAEDTMLLQHSLQPESLKGLGYLGSLYTDFGAWKVDHKNQQTIKRDN